MKRDEEDPTTFVLHNCFCCHRKAMSNRTLGRESEYEREVATRCFAEDRQPELLTKLDEGSASELEYRFEEVDRKVVVEEPEARDRLEFSAHSQLARAGQSVEKNQPGHSNPPCRRLTDRALSCVAEAADSRRGTQG